jgi:hypothetical protein
VCATASGSAIDAVRSNGKEKRPRETRAKRSDLLMYFVEE